MSVSWYKKGTQGRLSIREKETIKEINEIISKNNIDTSTWSTLTTIDDLEDLKDDLIDDYGEVDESDSYEEVKEQDSDPVEEPKLKEPIEQPDIQSEETLELGDFIETEPKHAFAEPFKEEDMFKANNTSIASNDSQVESTAENSNSELQDPLAILKKKQRLQQISQSVPSTQESDEDDSPKTEEEKRKVSLGKKTKRKATKQFADKVVVLLELVVESTAKMYAKYPDRKLKKAVDEGLLDLNYVFGDSGETVQQFIDRYRENLDDAISTDEEMHDEMVDAVLLYMEEQEIEVTPKVNAGITIATYVITVYVEAFKQRRMIDKAVEQMKDNYALNQKIYTEQKAEIEKLREELKWKNSSNNNAPMELEFKMPKSSDKPSIQLVNGEQKDPPVKREFKESENMIETITSEITGDSRPENLKKK